MANKRIKGITIEIGADSTGLDKALKGVEGGANKAKEELREVDRALKNAPESAVLWAQKQELLTKALEESRKKVDLLRDAQDQVNRQFQEGKISEEQYRAFQREVEKAEADVQRLTGELEKSKDGMKKMSENSDDAAEALEKTGESAEETGGKLDKISGIAVAAGAALAGAAKGAYESWEEVDEGYDTIIQKTGVTGENLKEFQSIADEVFTNLPVEMSDVGTAIGEVNTRFQVTDDLLKTISEDFLIYAQLNGRDVNSSIDNVSASMKAFDIEAEQAGKVLDTLTAVGQSTGVDLAQLESVLLANSATFKEMDLSIGESIQLLGQFEINGVDTATALAGLKKAQQNATAEGKTMSEALNDNISKIKNAKTETEALQIATDLFGKKGAAAMAQAISEGRFELETLTADMNAFSGITKTTFEATLSAPDKLKVTLNNLKLEGAELAEKVLPKIEKGADYLVKNLPKIENTLEKSMPLVKGIAAGFVAWKAMNAVSTGISLVKDLSTALRTGDTAMRALNTTMLANPAIAVGTAIIGLTVSVSEYIKTCEPHKTELDKLLEKEQEYMQGIRDTRDAINEKKDAALEAADADLIQLDKAENLWKELDKLADSTGKVKDKDKERVDFILNELNEAFGTEYKLVDDQIQKYGELKDSIDKVIQMKRANIYLEAGEEAYSAALLEVNNLENKQIQNEKDLRALKEEQAKLKKSDGSSFTRDDYKYKDKIYDQLDSKRATLELQAQRAKKIDVEEYYRLLGEIKKVDNEKALYEKNANFYQEMDNLSTRMNQLDGQIADYYEDIADHEAARAAMLEENYDEVIKLTTGKSRAERKYTEDLGVEQEKQRKILEDSVETAEIAYKQKLKQYENGVAGITKETVDGLYDTWVQAKLCLEDFDKSCTETLKANADKLQELIISNINFKFVNFQSVFGSLFTPTLAKSNERINQYAKGGYISGSSAGKGIVAEAGPELLEIVNGGVKITPLSDTARNTAVGGNSNDIKIYNTFHVQKMDKDTDIYSVSEKLSRITAESLRGKGLI